jgi:uncharacterized protein (DUF1778 family)
MPNQHKHRPLSVRLPEDDRAWVIEAAAAAGRAVNSLIVEAVRELRKRQPEAQPKAAPEGAKP